MDANFLAQMGMSSTPQGIPGAAAGAVVPKPSGVLTGSGSTDQRIFEKQVLKKFFFKVCFLKNFFKIIQYFFFHKKNSHFSLKKSQNFCRKKNTFPKKLI